MASIHPLRWIDGYFSKKILLCKGIGVETQNTISQLQEQIEDLKHDLQKAEERT